MMRKLIHVSLIISFALLIFGYPVWAMYSKSSSNHKNQVPGFQSTPKEFLQVCQLRTNQNFPGIVNRDLQTPPISQSDSGLSFAPALLLVNKEKGLAPNYIPSDLRVPRIPFSFTKNLPYKKMTAEAASALEKLYYQAKQEHVELVGVSGYRSYDYQKAIYRWNVREVGKKQADKTSAAPGYSEHQTGLAMDLSTPYLHYKLDKKFGATQAGQWLATHASEFGFIIRYPQGKEEITGYHYEPWHIRYVGEEHARKIAGAGLTLEEYLNNFN
jgi:D-alanyl-D-alanine carboxypeptidase